MLKTTNKILMKMFLGRIWRMKKMTVLDRISHLIVDLTWTTVDSSILQLRTIDFWTHKTG